MDDWLRDAWVAEMWKTCPEVSRHEREEKRKSDRDQQRRIEEREALNSPSTVDAQDSAQSSTGCADNGGQPLSTGGAECA
jgi:hypothetical protein